jgi:hypothetical protein
VPIAQSETTLGRYPISSSLWPLNHFTTRQFPAERRSALSFIWMDNQARRLAGNPSSDST